MRRHFYTRGDSCDWGGVCFTHAHAERDRVVLHGRFYVAHVPSNSLRPGPGRSDPTFNGLVLDREEGDRLVKVMNGKRVLMHANHGVIICGDSVAEAFDDLYYLERAAEVQILAMSTGKALRIVPENVANQFLVDMKKDGGKSELGQVTLRRVKERVDANTRWGEVLPVKKTIQVAEKHLYHQ